MGEDWERALTVLDSAYSDSASIDSQVEHCSRVASGDSATHVIIADPARLRILT
jgi:hypothetical protein